jgi:hypothetical protein
MKKTSIVAALAAGMMLLAARDGALAAELNPPELHPASDPAVTTRGSDVTVMPQNGAGHVRVHFSGADLLYRDSPGDLTVLKTDGAHMHYRPNAYQLIDGRMKRVDVNFQIEGKDEATVWFGKLDRSAPVILKWGAVMSSQPSGM